MTATTKRRLFLLTVGAVTAVVAPVFVSRWQDEGRYRAAVARLNADDPYWRLDDRAEHLRAEPLPDDANIAGPLAAAHAALGRLDANWRGWHEERTRGLVPNVRLTPEQWRSTIEAVEAHEDAILPTLDLDRYPRGRFDFEYAPNGVQVAVPHFNHIHQLDGWLLEPLYLAAVQRGDAATALRAIRVRLNFSRSLAEVPTVYGPLSRNRYRALVVTDLERLLGHVELSDTQLATIERDLRRELDDDLWPQLIRSELATTDRVMTAIGNGLIMPSDTRKFGPIPVARGQVPLDDFRYWIRDRTGIHVAAQHAELLEINAAAVATGRLAWPARWAAVQALPRRYDPARPELVRWLTADFARLYVQFALDEARLRSAAVALAIERYRRANGDWPKSLADVGPLPDDPFTGKPLAYRRTTDGVAVYSLSFDGKDDGGAMIDPRYYDRTGAGAWPDDVGFRLYDVKRRNLPPGDKP
ncbi:MAG: hypothetical protein U0746_19840 [Gemmataceae bacterium]